jgi:superfamily II DNA helicase RecQ
MSIKEIATAEVKKTLVKLMLDVSNGKYTVQVVDVSGPMSTWSNKDEFDTREREDANSIFLCQVKRLLAADDRWKDAFPEDKTDDTMEAEQAKTRLETNLRTWRRKEAEERGWPPYRVLTENTLRHLVDKDPVQNMEELAMVPGFGPKKLAQFGESLLAVITNEAEAET